MGGGGAGFLGPSAARNPMPSSAPWPRSATAPWARAGRGSRSCRGSSVRSFTRASRCGTSSTTVPSGSTILRPSTAMGLGVRDDVDERAQVPLDAADRQLAGVGRQRALDEVPQARPLEHDRRRQDRERNSPHDPDRGEADHSSQARLGQGRRHFLTNPRSVGDCGRPALRGAATRAREVGSRPEWHPKAQPLHPRRPELPVSRVPRAAAAQDDPGEQTGAIYGLVPDAARDRARAAAHAPVRRLRRARRELPARDLHRVQGAPPAHAARARGPDRHGAHVIEAFGLADARGARVRGRRHHRHAGQVGAARGHGGRHLLVGQGPACSSATTTCRSSTR